MSARNICSRCEMWEPTGLGEGKCNSSYFVQELKVRLETPAKGLVFSNWSGCRGGFRTSNTFGCVNFKLHPSLRTVKQESVNAT